MIPVRPIILCGGSGTRLWPLSTSQTPKQFVSLFEGATLFELTLRRLPEWALEPIVVTGEVLVDQVRAGLSTAGVTPHSILVEPEPRNTAPAIVAAASATADNEVLAVLPSDHLIGDGEAFAAALATAAQAATDGHIVVFGVTPDRPATGYGYIRPARSNHSWSTVEEFVEKPSVDRATALIDEGCLWNSGMFVMSTSTVLSETRRLAPEIASSAIVSVGRADREVVPIGPEFMSAPSISFDHAVMEKTDTAVVVELDAGWTDVGSFQTLWQTLSHDNNGNVAQGNVVTEEVSNSLIISTTRPVGVAGLDDIVVIETAEGVVVVPRQLSQTVKLLVEKLSDHD